MSKTILLEDQSILQAKESDKFLDMHSAEVPPSADRGALNTKLQFRVDWNAFTIVPAKLPELHVGLEDVFDVLGLNIHDFTEMPGHYGYTHSLRWNNIVVNFRKPLDKQGVHIEMSGEGCRWFEKVSSILPHDWADRGDVWLILWSRLVDLEAKYTRLDLAIDDFHGIFTLDQVIEQVKSGNWTSRFRGSDKNPAITVLEGYNPDSKGSATVYAGTPTSRIRIRIYDKGKKEGFDGHWVRTELQLRDERATNAVAHMIGGLSVGEVAVGTLRNYLHFREDNGDANKSRWPLVGWWDEFLGNVEKLRLTDAKIEKTFEEVEAWFDKQVDATLSMLRDVYGDKFDEIIHEKASNGKKKYTKRHFALVNDALDAVEVLEDRTGDILKRRKRELLNSPTVLFFESAKK